MINLRILHTEFGPLTLYSDQEGVCALSLPNESAPQQVAELVEEGPGHALLDEADRQVRAYLEGRLRCFDLPLSIRGTPFQLQVWEQLRQIPYGKTKSYKDIALALGSRHKARAVGGAAHANPIAILIPCHRLIGANGNLVGFAGGLALKKKLLALEAALP